tara:strand:- start:968 stop:1378 length:411 start_codon:yes stop_codon:yes gene_type:complete
MNKDQLNFFISHHNESKKLAKELVDGLIEEFNANCFVAHESIDAGAEWQRELLNNLKKMDILISIISRSYNSSFWCNQEIGFAFGKNKPIVIFKPENFSTPVGLISHIQAAHNVESLLVNIKNKLKEKKIKNIKVI